MLIEGAGRMGLSPISKRRIHHLVFIANALAELGMVQAIDERIVRFERGPYYPDAQWHLDRLVGQGLAAVQNIRYERHRDGRWLEADYSITTRGVQVTEQLRLLDEYRTIYRYGCEITRAFAELEDTWADEVVPTDLTYRDPLCSDETLIIFTQENQSTSTARKFGSLVSVSELCTNFDQLALYLAYLEKVGLQRAAGE